MRKLSSLGNTSNLFSKKSWFSCGKFDNSVESFPVYIQDPTHIGTKMRNFFLKTIRNPLKLPFGKYFILQSHLRFIIDNFTKDKHCLTPTILNPFDKQNFESVLRMTDKKVTDLLIQNVVESIGTAKFLEIIRKIIDSFMDQSLKPLERVYKIWYSVFMLRLWRNFIINQKPLTLKDNFLTVNCLSCIELNAHSLIFCLLQLKENELSHAFIPSSYDSQPCEAMFRQVRSFTTTYSTVANCSVKEILHRISKIQLQNDIEVMDLIFTFQNHRSHEIKPPKIFDLPAKDQIEEKIECAKKDALMDEVRLGLIKRESAYYVDLSCKINPIDENAKEKKKKIKKKDCLPSNQIENIMKLKTILLKNFSNKFDTEDVSENSQYVEVILDSNRRTIIKKTSLCWLLRTDCHKLSSDRLQRVRSVGKSKIGKIDVAHKVFRPNKIRKTNRKRNGNK